MKFPGLLLLLEMLSLFLPLLRPTFSVIKSQRRPKGYLSTGGSEKIRNFPWSYPDVAAAGAAAAASAPASAAALVFTTALAVVTTVAAAEAGAEAAAAAPAAAASG